MPSDKVMGRDLAAEAQEILKNYAAISAVSDDREPSIDITAFFRALANEVQHLRTKVQRQSRELISLKGRCHD